MEHYFTNNDNIKSELKNIIYKYNDISFCFHTDNGVFAKSYIDFGSKLLVETILKQNIKANNLLDVGCGYGFMGIVLGKIYEIPVDLIDINNRALHLCEMNILENKVTGKVFLSDAYENIKDKYEMIISNPPIRAGKEKVLEILLGAKEHLSENGKLIFVIRKEQGAKSILKIIENNYKKSEILEKSKGFYIIIAKLN